jgi:hypothetical protein
VVYVDDIIITWNDEEERKGLNKMLASFFEVKDLAHLHYFLELMWLMDHKVHISHGENMFLIYFM